MLILYKEDKTTWKTYSRFISLSHLLLKMAFEDRGMHRGEMANGPSSHINSKFTAKGYLELCAEDVLSCPGLHGEVCVVSDALGIRQWPRCPALSLPPSRVWLIPFSNRVGEAHAGPASALCPVALQGQSPGCVAPELSWRSESPSTFSPAPFLFLFLFFFWVSCESLVPITIKIRITANISWA